MNDPKSSNEEQTQESSRSSRPERPSKRYTLTAHSDAYRLDRDEKPEIPEWVLQRAAALPLSSEPIDPAILAELSLPLVEPLAKADRQGGTLGKSRAGLHGLKLAIRGDSSFFAHGYRFTIVLMFGVMIQLAPVAWLLLCLCAGLILLAELQNSAIDTFVRCSNPEEEHARAARDIGAAGVLISVFIGAAVTLALFVIRFRELLAE